MQPCKEGEGTLLQYYKRSSHINYIENNKPMFVRLKTSCNELDVTEYNTNYSHGK